jgi:hypothetical protein
MNALCSTVPIPLIAAWKFFIPSIKLACSNKIQYRYELSALILNLSTAQGATGDNDKILKNIDKRRQRYAFLGIASSSAVLYKTAYFIHTLCTA